MEIRFEEKTKKSKHIKELAEQFFKEISTLESKLSLPIIIFQDGVNSSYYSKCHILASIASKFIDLNAKINASDRESFRANRELML
ncbi:MAG: hypothetical protein ACYS21_11810, partial [Planctomycetota bacterium]